MTNMKTVAVALVTLMGSASFASADANTIGFTMAGASNSATIGTRVIEQTGSGNEVTATLNGSIKTLTFKQTGNTNKSTLTFGGSGNAQASFASTVVGSTNTIATTIGAVTAAFTYALDIAGSSNSVTEKFAAATSVDQDTDINGSSNTSTMLIKAAAILSNYIVTGDGNLLGIYADNGDIASYASDINVSGNSNSITDYVGVRVTSLENDIMLTGSSNTLTLIQNAAISKIDATVDATSLNMSVSQLGTTANGLITEINAGAGSTYTVTQSASISNFTDNVNLSAGGLSTVTVTN